LTFKGFEPSGTFSVFSSLYVAKDNEQGDDEDHIGCDYDSIDPDVKRITMVIGLIVKAW